MIEVLLENVLERSSRFPIPSLKDIAKLRIATTLCNNPQLIGLIKNCKFTEDRKGISRLYTKNEEEFKMVEAMGKELISKIISKGIYEEMILELLWTATYRIILWKLTYAPTINNEFLSLFYWTNQGRIDNIRTAKYIIASKTIPIQNRLELAFKFCLKEEIYKLWEREVNEDNYHLITRYFNENICPLYSHWLNELVAVSIYPSEGDLIKLLDSAIRFQSKQALTYLFKMMPINMKSNKAIRCLNFLREKTDAYFLDEEESDIACFIISQITVRYPEEFFRAYFRVIFSILLNSSEQDEFLKLWNEGLEFASERDIEVVLSMIFYKCHVEIVSGYDYYNLFICVWENIPAPLKDAIKKKTHLWVRGFCALIKDGFQYIFPVDTSTIVAHIAALNLIPSTATTSYTLKQEKVNLLRYLFDQGLISISILNQYKVMITLKLQQEGKRIDWIRLMTFINNILEE